MYISSYRVRKIIEKWCFEEVLFIVTAIKRGKIK